MISSRRARSGFTLVEMMIVLTIIAIVAMIALPKVGNLIRAANESATRAKLSSIRSALAMYYTDNEGIYPSALDPLLQPGSKYLTQVVPVYTQAHGSSSDIHYVPAVNDDDTGAWGYVNTGAQAGQIWVQCTHTDLKGMQWNKY